MKPRRPSYMDWEESQNQIRALQGNELGRGRTIILKESDKDRELREQMEAGAARGRSRMRREQYLNSLKAKRRAARLDGNHELIKHYDGLIKLVEPPELSREKIRAVKR